MEDTGGEYGKWVVVHVGKRRYHSAISLHSSTTLFAIVPYLDP